MGSVWRLLRSRLLSIGMILGIAFLLIHAAGSLAVVMIWVSTRLFSRLKPR